MAVIVGFFLIMLVSWLGMASKYLNQGCGKCKMYVNFREKILDSLYNYLVTYFKSRAVGEGPNRNIF